MARPSVARPTLIVHTPSTLETNGVTVRSTDAKPLLADFAHGETSDAASTVRVQRTEPISVLSGVHVRITNSNLDVLTTDTATVTRITETVTAASGKSLSAPRQLSIAQVH